MSAETHPAATHHLPMFITAPGQTDTLMVVMAIFLAIIVFAVGVLFLRLHTLPERIAHRGHKLQFEIVAVLGLIALFTHMHIFWVAGLLLALIDFPNIGGWMGRIAGSVEKMAGLKPGEGATLAEAGEPGPHPDQEPPEPPPEPVGDIRRREAGAPVPSPELAPAVTRS
jgi:hypothetical protein